MKKFKIINAIILSFIASIASNTFALGTVAESQLESRLASKQIEYKDTGTFKGYIHKRTSLGETIPLSLRLEEKRLVRSSFHPPRAYNAIKNKRLIFGENYPN